MTLVFKQIIYLIHTFSTHSNSIYICISDIGHAAVALDIKN